jgi:hypothetical protein
VVAAEQSELRISTPRAATLSLRVRWSRFLRVTGPNGVGQLEADGQGWTTLVAPRAGTYRVSA